MYNLVRKLIYNCIALLTLIYFQGTSQRIPTIDHSSSLEIFLSMYVVRLVCVIGEFHSHA